MNVAERGPMNMGRGEPGFLEVAALVCTIIAAVLTIADWMVRVF